MKKFMKKYLAVFLAAGIAAGVLSGCAKGGNTASNAASGSAGADPNDPYAEHISFTCLSIDDSKDFMEWPIVKEAMEKFNFDFKIQQVAYESWGDTLRTLAATDSLPEVIAWYNLPSYHEYADWAQQGVLKPLPEDMSDYPELQKLMNEHSVFEKLKIDGKLYAFPKINLNNPYNSYDPYIFVYRRDWAQKMGLDYEPMQNMTWEEFVDFLKQVQEQDPMQLGEKLVPLDFANGGQDWLRFAQQWNPVLGNYTKKDGKYVWGTADSSSLAAINTIKNLYDQGLLAQDSYADSMEMGKERFCAGRSAVYWTTLGPSTLMELLTNMKRVDPQLEDTDLGVLNVSIDGKYPVNELLDYWAAFAFSQKCTDEQMERWLAVGNWLLEQEQIEKVAYGIPGEDWTKADDGTVTLNYETSEKVPGQSKGYISEQAMFQKFFILEGLDATLPNNPNLSSYLINDCLKACMLSKEEAPRYTQIDWDLSFFSGTYLSQYGCLESPTSSALIQAVVSDDPEGVWNEFLSNNEDTISVVLEELNTNLT